MTFELGQLFLAGVAYLLLLFLIAWTAERGHLPEWVARHPATYALSLGVYATSWSYYGSVGFAASHGYHFLTIYLGVTLAFALTPILLLPILRIARDYQLTSLADLFAFRYHSQVAGILVTLFMLVGILPYIALQIRAVTESVLVLTEREAPALLALGFCLTLILFAILFGARHTTPREKHEGLVVAIAFESLVKLVALLFVGLFAVWGVFGGLGDLQQWLSERPEAVEALHAPVRENGAAWLAMTLLAFAAAFLLPRQFHMTFTENLEERNLISASWAFPLFLLLLNLAIVPILWAGSITAPDIDPDYYVLGLSLNSGASWLVVLTFLGGVSAASAMMIVTTLALSAMSLNHLVLPLRRLRSDDNLYRWLLNARRLLIVTIILAGYGFYLILEHHQGLAQLGLISFVAVAQFLPGVVGLLLWPRATRAGFLSGLSGGIAVWCVTLLLPLIERSGLLTFGYDITPLLQASGMETWTFATFWSLVVNGTLFVTVSLLGQPSREEAEAARACHRDSLFLPRTTVATPAQLRERLAHILGQETAEREIAQALDDLGLSADEPLPPNTRQRLGERIERNLSGLIGPVLAHMIVNHEMGLDNTERQHDHAAHHLRFAEDRLEDSRLELRGLAAELDSLRRYHRQILHDLPIGVLSVGPEQTVLSWNRAMSELSGLDERSVVDTSLDQLPQPWAGLIRSFLRGQDRFLRKIRMEIDGRDRWFNLHKAALADPLAGREPPSRGAVILVEDMTDLHTLEAELTHTERLASIGRLAAGVAHEIGNPVTGIACLAQNLRDEEEIDQARASAEQIIHLTGRINAIVQSLVSFSHSGEQRACAPLLERVTLRHCIDEAVELIRLGEVGKQRRLDNRCPDGLVIQGDAPRLIQVFVNLLSNAVLASEPGGLIEIDGRREEGLAVVELTDHGEGIAPELIERIFEPFFTTRQPGEGTGLGLPLVYSIIQDHAGSITIHSSPGEGTRVTLRLPLERNPEEEESLHEPDPDRRG